MAFDYNTLKQITTNGLIDGTIVTADFAAQSVQTANIQAGQILTNQFNAGAVTGGNIVSGNITSGTLATGAVPLNTSVVSGQLPIANGGTALASVGAAGQVLRVNNAGNGLEYQYTDLRNIQVFTSSGTYTKTAGVSRIRVQVVGSGGGGSGHGEAGGAGGFSERILDATGITTVSVTVGAINGGAGVNYHNVAGGGNTSSFGPYCSASGGEGGRNLGGHVGGRPGVGSGGNLNLYGGGGSGHTQYGGGGGGSSYFGGPSIGVHHNGPHTYDYETICAPGSGGPGAANTHGRGANGFRGMIIVWEYF